MWRQLGYMYDIHLKSSAENTRSQRGHAAINGHHQLSVLLDGLWKLQQGQDSCLQNVTLTINGVQCCVNVVVPILYFMNDTKEGDMLCGRVSGHHPATRQHCCICDVEFVNMLDFEINCNVLQPDVIEELVNNEDYDSLKAMSQYCVKSCFRGLVFVILCMVYLELNLVTWYIC